MISLTETIQFGRKRKPNHYIRGIYYGLERGFYPDMISDSVQKTKAKKLNNLERSSPWITKAQNYRGK